jgi:hypothetical protein
MADVSSTDSNNDMTVTDGASNLEQFLGVRGLPHVPHNPNGIPEATDQYLGDEFFEPCADQFNF